MELLYHEVGHLSISLIIGFLVWKVHKEPLSAFAGTLLGGFLIDADHMVDYVLYYGFNFNLSNFLNSTQFELSQKVYVPFHAWEYVILFSLLYIYLYNKFKIKKVKISKYLLGFVLALTLGIYSHLIIDSVTNNLVLPGYSIIYRYLNDFDINRISNH